MNDHNPGATSQTHLIFLLFFTVHCLMLFSGCGLLAPVGQPTEVSEEDRQKTENAKEEETTAVKVDEEIKAPQKEAIQSTGLLFLAGDRLQPALTAAKIEGKMVFLDFYTIWCLPCKIMDESVFPNEELGRFMNERFVSLKINAEKENGSNLAFIYGVSIFPTLVFLNAEGKVVLKYEGSTNTDGLLNLAKQALSGK